ncbi:MAG: hypothetical protein M9921_12010 [Fimbriimonadaceae bacterium]|nr:hypothetical protein [Fimbriimonadaceae bacterium]
MKPLVAVVMLLTILGCAKQGPSNQRVLPPKPVAKVNVEPVETSQLPRPGSPTANPKEWELAFVRDDDLWVGRGDGSGTTLVAKQANSPTWSFDGRWLAYRQGRTLRLMDTRTNKTTTLAEGGEVLETGPAGWGIDRVQMTFDPIQPKLVVAMGEGLRVFDLDGDPQSPRDILVNLNWIEGCPTWSPSGSKLAFTRNGDVWIALRNVERWRAAIRDGGGLHDEGGYSVDYYDDARRLVALAVWNDGETGVSARTPFWVDGLAWTADEKRLIFHFQRMGGSGVSQVGTIDLEPVESGDWELQSGFRTKVTWLTGIGETTLWPQVCPDGTRLSVVRDGGLEILPWDGSAPQSILGDVWDYAWRPFQPSNASISVNAPK